jgi:glycosyltransferase involved in cell wall biosynthesis
VATVHVHPDVYAAEPSSLRGRLTTRLLPTALYHADAVVCVSHGVADGVAAWTSRPRAAVDVIYNPIEVDAITAHRTPPPHPWFERRDPVVVTAGRLVRAKDVATLVRAVARLNGQTGKRERTVVRLLVLGDGPERDALRAQIRSLGLGDVVDLTGFVPNPYAYFHHADVFALASTHEAFGNVVVEAMACGCPVVCTRARGGVSEILHDPHTGERYGSLVPPRDPGALATAIEAALARPPDANRLHRRARDFHPSRAVDAYLRLAGVSESVVQGA